MEMCEPLIQIYRAENGFIVCVADEQAEKDAMKKSKDAMKAGMPMSSPEADKKVVFATVKDVVAYVQKNLPGLAAADKGDYEAAFEEEND